MNDYIKQNGKIIKSLLSNAEKLSREVVQYVADMEKKECTVWESGEDAAYDVPVLKITRYKMGTGYVLHFFMPDQIAPILFDELHPYTKTQVGLLLYTEVYEKMKKRNE